MTPLSLEDVLGRREPFGTRLGLLRMRALLASLGEPQRAARKIHVVGTNGKSSTVRFCAAIVAAHGSEVGAYVSPHVVGFHERVQVGGRAVEPDELAAVVERVEAAALGVDRALGDPVTQFEVLTAAAFLLFAERGAEVLVVEAGLGGRHDATNVIAAEVVALTNVALDHVAQLGSTRRSIAAEKLAVVAPGATLVVGGADAELRSIIGELAPPAARTTLLPVGVSVADAPELAAAGGFQRANLAVALEASEALLGRRFDRAMALAAAARVAAPGRAEIVAEEPRVVLDGAHNPHGAAALAAELGTLVGPRRPRVGVIAFAVAIILLVIAVSYGAGYLIGRTLLQ